ncbi:MAG TPA: AsmA-like C-terminal region-containing protein [Thermodesulfobacteriota bacterium]|nr:AsmA-like C-terminal region-containing protein [Thermodesulfobacteriota bacterium]
MRKIIIIVLVLIIILAGLVTFAIFSLNTLVNKNKDYLLSKVEESLGRDVSVEKFEVNPWDMGVKLMNFAVSDDPAFSQEPFIQASYLQVNLEFLPLLQKKLRVDELILRQPVIRVVRNKNGEFNFENLGSAEKEKDKEEKVEERKEEEELPLYVSLVDIDGGEVYYIDREGGTEFQVKKLDLTVEDISRDQPISIDLNAALAADKQNLGIEGQVGPLGSEPDFDKLPIEGKVEINQLNIDKLKESLPLIKEHLPEDLNVKGPLSLSANVEGTPENLVLSESTLEATASEVNFGDQFQKPAGVPLILSTGARITKNAINLKDTNINLATLKLNLDGEIGLGETPSLNLAVNSDQAELSALEKTLTALKDYDLSGSFKVNAKIQGEVGEGKVPNVNGILTIADAKAVVPKIAKPIRDLDAKVNFTGQAARLEETSFFLGDSKFSLSAQVEKFSPLALTYNLSSPELKLADLKASESADKNPGVLREVKSQGRVSKENESLSYNGTFSSTQGIISDMQFTNLQSALTLANEVLTVENLKLQALDGYLKASGKYNLNEPSPFTLSSQVQNIDIKKLLQSMDSEGSENIQGQANIVLNLSGRGKGWEEIKPTLQGEGQAEIVNGAVLDVNIAEEVLSGVTGIPGLTHLVSPRIRNKYPEIFATQNTNFDEFYLPFTLSNEKMQTDNLRISSSDYLINGKGWIGFNKRVDLNSLLILSEKLSQDIAKDVDVAKYIANEQGRLEIPFVMSGTLPGVKPKPDVSYLAQLIQRATIRKGTEELKEKVLKKILPPSKETSEKEKQTTPDTEGEGVEKQLRKGLKDLLGK